MSDLISRQAAIDALGEKPLAWTEGEYELGLQNQWQSDVDALNDLPSVQPERLTDDDFETIRIHLRAHMEDLCNQHRWKEAQEYQRIIDKFMAFAQSKTAERMSETEQNVLNGELISKKVAIDAVHKAIFKFFDMKTEAIPVRKG